MKYLAFIVLMLGTACVVFISGFQLPTVVSLLVFSTAIALDFFTTWKCLKAGGTEGNPVIAFLFRKLTVKGTFALMVGLWIVFIIYRWLPSTVGAQTAVAVAYCWLPINNQLVTWGRKRAQAKRAQHAQCPC